MSYNCSASVPRMWRNEVNMRKRERARQQAEELRKMQKLFLLKAMSSPGDIILLVTGASNEDYAKMYNHREGPY